MNEKDNKKIFSKNLNYYMELYNKDRNKVCDDLGIPYNTLTDWANGNVYPRTIDKIEMLANYFNIEKSDLIEDKPKNEKDEKAKILTNAFRKSGMMNPDEEDLTDEEFERMKKYYEANKDFIRIKK